MNANLVGSRALVLRSMRASQSLSQHWQYRVVTPELLDCISYDDPSAIRARRELGIVNMMMGNYRWIAAQLRRYPSGRILEVGAGDGRLGAYLVRNGICAPTRLTGLDVIPKPQGWPVHASWREQDLLEGDLPEVEIVIANLLLHQFKSNQLRIVGEELSRHCRVLIAVDPARTRLSLLLGRLLAMATRMHPLTVHDMILSVHAGFRGDELPLALGLRGWSAEVRTTFRGGYRIVARNQKTEL